MRSATIPHTGRAHDAYAAGETRRDVWAGVGGLLLLVLGCNIIPGAATALVYYQTREAPFGALDIPWWTPPLTVWAAVGFATYTLMAIGAWLIVRQRDVTILGRWATVPFETQLALGGLAAIALFALYVPGPALALLIVQAGAVVVTAMRFFYLSRPATWLMVLALGAVTALLAWTGMLVLLNPDVAP